MGEIFNLLMIEHLNKGENMLYITNNRPSITDEFSKFLDIKLSTPPDNSLLKKKEELKKSFENVIPDEVVEWLREQAKVKKNIESPEVKVAEKEKRPIIIALFGKAGSGKDFILKQFFSQCGCLAHKIIHCTSRPKRDEEVNGIDYFFYPKSFFEESPNEWLSLRQFNNWYYGLRETEIVKDKVNIGIFSISEIRALIALDRYDIHPIEISCEDDNKRYIRQLQRGDDISEVFRRSITDKEDFMFIDFRFRQLDNSSQDYKKNKTALDLYSITRELEKRL